MGDNSDSNNKSSTNSNRGAALVFGASGEQGRAVLEGFVDAGFSPVYGFSSDPDTISDQYLSDALQCILLEGRINDPADVRKALESTKAQAIFLTTTYEMPVSQGATAYQAAQDEEYDTIVQWFETLQQVCNEDKIPRTVIFSTRDNVQELARTKFELTGKDDWIEPLDDGSVVPHFSAKGRGGEQALKMLKDGNNPNLKLVLLTLPFFYSNFLAFFCPLPNEGRTDWELSGCFGDGETKIDMMSVSDLGTLVVSVYRQAEKYNGQILRLASERISMDEIAKEFSDLFGKDVVYNPLLPKELAALDFPAAPAMAQMCQFLGDSRELVHDLELTHSLAHPRKLANFETWLLTHSDSTAFSRVGLDRDAEPLNKICVFGALSPQGQSVVKGLLADSRKSYEIRCTTRRNLETTKEVQETIALDPNRISFVEADFDNVESCQKAVQGMDGVFLVADLHEHPSLGGENDDDQQSAKQKGYLESEERHVKNIIDACEGNVRHVIFSTMESSEKVNTDLPERDLLEFSPKARAAAYARSKKLSVTFVLVPFYSEMFFEMMDIRKDETTGKDKVVMQVPGGFDAKIMVMSVEELGPAVANIFDSYECFAGHEIGLVTDFVSTREVQSIIQEVFSDELNVETENVETKDWIEARDTYMRDLGQLFSGLSHSEAVTSRHSMAKTYQLVPNVRSLRRWVEHNRDNPTFREKLGLR